MTTGAELGRALGVRFDPRDNDQVTIADIRIAYQRHGLFTDALRLLEREMTEAVTSEEKQRLFGEKAEVQRRAGQAGLARQTARELETQLLALAQASPRSGTFLQLAHLYMGKAYGPDYAKAADAFASAARVDPAVDPGGIGAFECLYKADKHKEAWAVWERARRNGTPQVFDEPTLYYACLAASKVGDQASARSLGRQAVYLYPASPLAKQVRELIND
jgi:hypothetical protein